VGDLTRGDGNLPDLPNFSSLDRVWPALAAVRRDVAEARDATQELVDKLTQAIEVTQVWAGALTEAYSPAKKMLCLAYLGLLLKAYPNSGQQDAKIFGQMLLEDVMSLSPSTGAVEMACRSWRRRSKFLPAIAEMLDEVRAADAEVQGTKEFSSRLLDLRDRLRQELKKSG